MEGVSGMVSHTYWSGDTHVPMANMSQDVAISVAVRLKLSLTIVEMNYVFSTDTPGLLVEQGVLKLGP